MRQEYEITLEPLLSVPVERELPLRQRLWQQGWLRKGLILIVLAILWEAAGRHNDEACITALERALAKAELKAA